MMALHHHQQQTQRRQGVITFLLATKFSSIPIVILAFVGVLLLQAPSGAEAFSPSSHYSQPSRTQSYTTSTSTSRSRTTTPRRSRSRTTTVVSSSTDDTLELLKDLPFVPKEVLGKFLTNVGVSVTSANLQAGYHAGVVTREELDDIQQLLPEIGGNTQQESIQSIAEIRGYWDESLVGQPWVIRKVGEFAAPTVVGLVAKMQEKTVRQAGAMKWINYAALDVLQANTTILTLLSSSISSSGGGVTKLRFNNTRARFEEDKQVWSASMDVFFDNTPIDSAAAAVTQTNDGGTTANEMEEPTPSTDATIALAALMEGTDDDTDDLSSLRGSVTVVDDNTRQSVIPNETVAAASSPPAIVGLVNAYFIPEEEIKILVVEIDDVLHNVTWKGL